MTTTQEKAVGAGKNSTAYAYFRVEESGKG